MRTWTSSRLHSGPGAGDNRSMCGHRRSSNAAHPVPRSDEYKIAQFEVQSVEALAAGRSPLSPPVLADAGAPHHRPACTPRDRAHARAVAASPTEASAAAAMPPADAAEPDEHKVAPDDAEGARTGNAADLAAEVQRVVATMTSAQLRAPPSSTGYRVGYFRQFAVLSHRIWLDNLRNPGVFWVRLIMCVRQPRARAPRALDASCASRYIMLCFLIGTMFANVGTSEESITQRVAMLFYTAAFLVFMSIAAMPFFIQVRQRAAARRRARALITRRSGRRATCSSASAPTGITPCCPLCWPTPSCRCLALRRSQCPAPSWSTSSPA